MTTTLPAVSSTDLRPVKRFIIRGMDSSTLDYYSANATQVAQRYEEVTSSLGPRIASSLHAGRRVLDIGCGSERDLAELARQGFDPFAVDGTPEFVELAQQYHPELKVKVTHGLLPDFTVTFGGEFDGVWQAHNDAERELRRCQGANGKLPFN